MNAGLTIKEYTNAVGSGITRCMVRHYYQLVLVQQLVQFTINEPQK
jgi:hypothetical protein